MEPVAFALSVADFASGPVSVEVAAAELADGVHCADFQGHPQRAIKRVQQRLSCSHC